MYINEIVFHLKSSCWSCRILAFRTYKSVLMTTAATSISVIDKRRH